MQTAERAQKVRRVPHVAKRVAVWRQRRYDVDVAKGQRKLGRQHADDDERLAVDPDGVADDGWGPAILALPKPVADDDHLRRVGAIVAILQEPPGRRGHSQYFEG